MDAPVADRTSRGAVLGLSLLVGMLAAFSIGVGVRKYHGRAPGIPLVPFVHLLGKPALELALATLDEDGVVQPEVGPAGWIVYFTDSRCGACDLAYPGLAALIVGVGVRDSLRVKLARAGVRAVTLYDSLEISRAAYGVSGVPAGVWIDADGIVRHGAMGTTAPGALGTAVAAAAVEER